MQGDCNPSTALWAGVDVSKEQVDFFILNGKDNPSGRRPRRVAALAKLAESGRALGVTHALVEATGGYERMVWAALEAAGIQVTVVQPRRVRYFARACGVEAKNDPIDAEMLARFGAGLQPASTPLPSAAMQRYRELERQLGYVVGLRAQLRTRRHHCEESEVRDSNERLIAGLSAEIEQLEQSVHRALAAMPETAELVRRLQQAAGVGPKTAWALTAELPELGTLTGKEAAALAGLAPYARDSGASSGRRSIAGGRERVRTALYLAARAAVRVDRRLKAFYERLQAAGKQKQLGLIAVARRLLVMLNAMIRDCVDWRPYPVT